jgi:hypothetical protein
MVHVSPQDTSVNAFIGYNSSFHVHYLVFRVSVTSELLKQLMDFRKTYVILKSASNLHLLFSYHK